VFNVKKKNHYPLGHDKAEEKRLNKQASLLHDPELESYIRRAKSCLEIGCGVGSNLRWILGVNPKIRCVGVDISADAIAKARASLSNTSAELHVMDATNLKLTDSSFDLVFTKLVLWAAGKKWRHVVKEAHRVLKKGGLLYSFEPDDQLVMFDPPKPNFEMLIGLWDQDMIQKGLDPFVGRKVYGAFVETGFQNTQSRIFAKTSRGVDKETYDKAAANLAHLYMGKGGEALGLREESSFWKSAKKEISQRRDKDFLVDAYFVTRGEK
jgi:ubiquinone/menaquinone biosynthesis C-methylase UbiE